VENPLHVNRFSQLVVPTMGDMGVRFIKSKIGQTRCWVIEV